MKCPNCKGKGTFPATRTKPASICPHCEGTGQIQQAVSVVNPENSLIPPEMQEQMQQIVVQTVQQALNPIVRHMKNQEHMTGKMLNAMRNQARSSGAALDDDDWNEMHDSWMEAHPEYDGDNR